jgi:hypothetical protein
VRSVGAKILHEFLAFSLVNYTTHHDRLDIITESIMGDIHKHKSESSSSCDTVK